MKKLFKSIVWTCAAVLLSTLPPVVAFSETETPIPVTIVNHQPVQESKFLDLAEGYPGPSYDQDWDMYQVPDDKLLIIEYFSCYINTAKGERVSCSIGTTLDGVEVYHYLPTSEFTVMNTWIASFFWRHLSVVQVGQTVKLYAGPRTLVNVGASRSGRCAMPTRVHFSFSGYLVDVDGEGFGGE